LDASGDPAFVVLRSFPVEKAAIDGPPYFTFSGPVVDLNGDARNDIIAVSEALRSIPPGDGATNIFPMVATALGNGEGEFSGFEHFLSLPLKESGKPVAQLRNRPEHLSADLNGDGFPDIVFPVTAETSPGMASVLLNDSGKGFSPPEIYVTLDNNRPLTSSVDVIDVDYDGDVDLLAGHGDRQEFSVLLNDGSGAFALNTVVSLANLPEVGVPWHVEGEDLNGDGQCDAIAFDTERIILIFSILDPLRRATEVIRTTGESEFRTMVRVGDMNNDGLVDVIVNGGACERHFAPCKLSIFLGQSARDFVRGDANKDSEVNLSDALGILGYLFLGTKTPACLDSADADDDGIVELTDAVYLLSFLFLGTAQLPPPYPVAGTDPTVDSMFCNG
jgi:hypothetical protein